MRDWLKKATAADSLGSRSRRGDKDLNPGFDDSVFKKYDGREAAVLVPVVEHPEGPTVILTQRTEHLNNHAGQISFPGGAIDDSDASPEAAALREAHEEIGLDPSFVEVIGRLDMYETSTGFHVTPVVGLVRPGFELKLDEFEVADAFEVPLDFLLDPKNHQKQSRVWQEKERFFYVMPYAERYIWGATAGMIKNLYDVMIAAKHKS